MPDIINEIMDFFLNLLVDKSIQGINKSNKKKIMVFLIINVISIFSLGIVFTMPLSSASFLFAVFTFFNMAFVSISSVIVILFN